MRTPFSRFALIALLLAVGIGIGRPGRARGQPPPDALAAERAALAHYDLRGDRTLAVLGALAARASSDEGPVVIAARALRVRAASDLFLIARLEPQRLGLESRLARALAVRLSTMSSVLHTEIETLRGSADAAVLTDALDSLALADELGGEATGGASAHSGVRGDLLLLHRAQSGIESTTAFDPCASPDAPCPPPWSSWDPPTRQRLGRMAAGSAAAARLALAREQGDPLASAVSDSIDGAREALDALRIDPSVWLDRADGLLAAETGDDAIEVDRVVVVDHSAVRSLRSTPIEVRAGEVRAVDGTLGMGLVRSPFSWRDAETTTVLAPGALAATASPELAVAPTQSAQCDTLWRLLSEARQHGVDRVAIVHRAPDGSLAGQHFALSGESGERGDVLVRVRPGYLVVERDGGSTSLPRSRGDAGLTADLPELLRAASRRSTHRIFVTYAAGARTQDVLRVATALQHGPHGTVSLAVH